MVKKKKAKTNTYKIINVSSLEISFWVVFITHKLLYNFTHPIFELKQWLQVTVLDQKLCVYPFGLCLLPPYRLLHHVTLLVGPLAFNMTHYAGGTPKTYYYPYSWTKVSTPHVLSNTITQFLHELHLIWCVMVMLLNVGKSFPRTPTFYL